MILQDAGEELLNGFRHRPDPADVAAPCGRLMTRFIELREDLPVSADPELTRCTFAVGQILDHHVLLLRTSLDLLAGAERSDLLDERLDDIDGLGPPARRLDAVREEILQRSTPGATGEMVGR